MKSFPTSRYKKYKVKYYYDVEWRNKEAVYVVIELPTNDIVKVFTFKEDAEEFINDFKMVIIEDIENYISVSYTHLTLPTKRIV